MQRPAATIEGPRFIADVMLGRLARWLRLLGFDTLYDPGWDDRTIARIAVRDQRLVLTRDQGLLARRLVRSGLFIESEELGSQLRQVLAAAGLSSDPARIFTRCTMCNELVTPISKDAVAGRVPPYVHRRHERFVQCPQCQRIYWGGTHQRLALRQLARLLRQDAPAGDADDAGPA